MTALAEMARRAIATRAAWHDDARVDYLIAVSAFQSACTPDVILRLLAAAQRAPRRCAVTRSPFVYSLNAMERAGMEENPAAVGYAAKRRAVLDYVEQLECECEADTARLHAALAVAREAIHTAVSDEAGLDGREGARVLALIAAARSPSIPERPDDAC